MLILPDTTNPTMVHKIPTHARKMLDQRNSEVPQLILVANSRLHEHLRRVQRTHGQDNFTPSIDAMNFPLVEDLHTGRFLALYGYPCHKCLRKHCQVWAVHVRKRISAKNGAASSILYIQIHNRGSAVTFHHATVLVLETGKPHRACPFHHGRGDWIRVRGRLDKNWPSGSTVLWVRLTLPVLNAPVEIEHCLIVPRHVARLRSKEIPVIPVSPCPNHRVNAGTSAEHFSHTRENRASVKVGIRLANK